MNKLVSLNVDSVLWESIPSKNKSEYVRGLLKDSLMCPEEVKEAVQHESAKYELKKKQLKQEYKMQLKQLEADRTYETSRLYSLLTKV